LKNIEAAVRDVARSDLLLRSPRLENGDPILFEHGQRVANNTAQIIRVAQSADAAAMDMDVLCAASYYYASAWAVQHEEGTVQRNEVLTKPLSDVQLELSSTRAALALREVLNPKRIELVCQVIRESGKRKTTHFAAHILTEAVNLDQIGPLSIWHTIRKLSDEGRGIEAALTVWERQREYNFWNARINDAFRYDFVKELARQRLNELDSFMQALSQHAISADLADAVESRSSRGAEQPRQH
jgi:hypothetical protein